MLLKIQIIGSSNFEVSHADSFKYFPFLETNRFKITVFVI